MNPIWTIIEGTIIGVVVIYSILGITDKKRFPDWVSYTVGVGLSFLCGINNTLVPFMDTTILFVASFLTIFFVFSKDRIVKRIVSFLVFIVTNIVLELFTEVIADSLGMSPEIYNAQIEFLRSFSTIFLCNAYLLAVLLYRRKKIKQVLLPTGILMLVPVLVLIYIIPAFVAQNDQDNVFVLLGAVALLINITLVFMFMRFNNVSSGIRERTKEKAVIAQIEGYDKKYFELVQAEIENMRFIRHDVVNYTEQIKALRENGDRESIMLAVQLSSELEERLKEKT